MIGVVWVVVGPAEATDPLSVLDDEAVLKEGVAIGEATREVTVPYSVLDDEDSTPVDVLAIAEV